MAEAETLSVRPRALLGKKVSRLRRQGVLPGVIAGHGRSTPVEIDTRAFELGYRRWGGTTLLALEGLPGGAVPALIHGLTRNNLTGRPLHVDFQRVSLTEKTHAEVPLHFHGESAAERTHGAVLLHAMDRVLVEAFPQDIPHRIEVDLSALAEIDDALHVRDLRIDVTKLRILAEPDELVAKAMMARVEEVAAPAPVAAAPEGEVPAAPQTEEKKEEK